MKLSVVERVMLGGMMSVYKCDFTALKLIREGREALSFTDEENGKLGFVQNGANLSWNPIASQEVGGVEIDFSETMVSIIKDMLTKLNDDRQLTENHFSLYEKFIQ